MTSTILFDYHIQSFFFRICLRTFYYYSHFSAALVSRWIISCQNIGTNKVRAVKDSVWSTSCRQNLFHELWGNNSFDSFSIILLNFWFCPGYALETSGWRPTIFCEVMSLLFVMIVCASDGLSFPDGESNPNGTAEEILWIRWCKNN